MSTSTSKIDFTFKDRLPTYLVYWTRTWENSEQKQVVTLAYDSKEEIMQEAKDNGVTITGLEPIGVLAHEKPKKLNPKKSLSEYLIFSVHQALRLLFAFFRTLNPTLLERRFRILCIRCFASQFL